MPSKIDAIIFDLGRVLVDFDHNRSATVMASASGLSVKEVYDLFFDSDLIQRFEAGRFSPQRFYRQVKHLLGFEMPMREFVAVWNDIFFISEKNRRVHALARSLSRRYPLAVLSNINELHLDFVRRHYRIFRPFRHFFASCEEGCVKPHPRIYRRALKRLGARPQRTVYIDDRPDLIAAARKLGMISFVFTDVERLQIDLSTLVRQ